MTHEEKAALAHEAHNQFSLDSIAAEILDAYALVDLMVPAADATNGGSPMWYGWAIREAYLRGILAERQRQKKE